jgi:hypothetical protein
MQLKLSTAPPKYNKTNHQQQKTIKKNRNFTKSFRKLILILLALNVENWSGP